MMDLAKYKQVQEWARHYDAPYVEGLAAISDRIELQPHCWLLDENGEITDLIWGTSLPDPVYIGAIVEPTEDGAPYFTEEELFNEFKVKRDTPAEEAIDG